MKRIVLSLLFLSACGEPPDFWVGWTPVYLEEGAREDIPCDFVMHIRETHRDLENRFGADDSNEIMSMPLRLYPEESTVEDEWNRKGYYNGLTENDEIKVRLRGNSMIYTGFIHEYVSHLACSIIYGNINANHDVEVCNQLETDTSSVVYQATRNLIECAD